MEPQRFICELQIMVSAVGLQAEALLRYTWTCLNKARFHYSFKMTQFFNLPNGDPRNSRIYTDDLDPLAKVIEQCGNRKPRALV